MTALKEHTFSTTNLAIWSAESSLIRALFSSKPCRNPVYFAGLVFFDTFMRGSERVSEQARERAKERARERDKERERERERD